jgi:hypothetical protein
MEHQILIREPSGEQKWLPISEVFRIARSYKKPTPTPVGTLVGFNKWYKSYKKTTTKAQAEAYWSKHIKPHMITKIMWHTKCYVDQVEKRYRLDPIRYLRNKKYNDEIIKQKKKINLDEDYPFDTTGNSRKGRCSACDKVVFGGKFTIHNEDSSCCKARIKQYR